MSQPPPSDPEPPPPLTPDLLADDEALADAVDAFVAADPEARERLAEIGVYVEGLRAGVEPDVWQVFLRIDGLVTARWADLAVALVRWGFLLGRQHPLLAGEVSS